MAEIRSGRQISDKIRQEVIYGGCENHHHQDGYRNIYTDGGKSKLVKFPPGTYYAEITNTSGAKLNIGLSVVGYSKASKAYLK